MKQFFKKPLLTFLGVFFLWLGFSIIIFLFFKNFDFSLSFPISLTNLGMFGDSFNILTSLFTGLAFAGLLISVRLQKEELGEVKKEFKEQTKALENQQKEMAIQSFDNKFFQMLNLFNNIIDSLSYRLAYPSKPLKLEKRKVLIEMKNIFLKKLNKNPTEFQNIFDEFNQQYSIIIKFYFINLYQILKYIDRQFKEDINSAKNYTNIVRAQLSKDELVLLFYNAMGVIPFSGENYKKLVEKYAFFEHLTYTDLNPNGNRPFVDELLKKYDLSAFGKNEDLRNKVLEIQKSLQ